MFWRKPPAPTLPHLKFLLLGDRSVGASSLTWRFARDTFLQPGENMIGIEFGLHPRCLEGEAVKLSLWDCPDVRRRGMYPVMSPAAFRSISCFGLVYDVTNRASFVGLSKWRDECTHYARPLSTLVLIANKIDSPLATHAVSTAEGMALASEWGVPFIEVSAKTGENVESLIMCLARSCRPLREEEARKVAAASAP